LFSISLYSIPCQILARDPTPIVWTGKRAYLARVSKRPFHIKVDKQAIFDLASKQRIICQIYDNNLATMEKYVIVICQLSST
jgi:hypothetical protein